MADGVVVRAAFGYKADPMIATGVTLQVAEAIDSVTFEPRIVLYMGHGDERAGIDMTVEFAEELAGELQAMARRARGKHFRA